MTISPPEPPPPVESDQPSVGGGTPLLRAVELADDGCQGSGPGPASGDDFFVEWQLGIAAGARW